MKTSDYVFWLAVPHDQKDQAREVAGRLPSGQQAIGYDKESKLWYARPGCDLERLSAWWPDHGRRAEGGDPEVEFSDALTAAGLKVQGLPIMNGKRQRVATIQDKPGKKSGVYCGFMDRFPAGWFINYHTADNEKDVTNWKATGGEADPEARLHIRAAARQNQDDVDRERAALHAERTAAAKSLYGRLPAADPNHGYLQRKGVTATDGIRQTRNGALVIPFYNVGGEFKTLQYIPPEGDKYLFKDAPKQGHFYVVGGPLRDGEQILYAEGYATARSLNMATGNPVVMTIDAGNMVTVAKILHTHYPQSGHLFLADLDHAKEVNKGLIMATEAAAQVGGQVLHPEFTDAEKAAGLTDFNDLHKSRGLEAVFTQVAPLLQSHNEDPTMKGAPQPAQRDVLATNTDMPTAAAVEDNLGDKTQPPMTPESAASHVLRTVRAPGFEQDLQSMAAAVPGTDQDFLSLAERDLNRFVSEALGIRTWLPITWTGELEIAKEKSQEGVPEHPGEEPSVFNVFAKDHDGSSVLLDVHVSRAKAEELVSKLQSINDNARPFDNSPSDAPSTAKLAVGEQLQPEVPPKKPRAKRTPASPAKPGGGKKVPSSDASVLVATSDPAAAPAAGEQSPAPDASAPVASSDSAAAPAAGEQSPAPDASAPVASSDQATAPAAGEQSPAPDASAPMASSDPATAPAAGEQSPAPDASAPMASSDPATAPAAGEQSPAPDASAPVASSDSAAAPAAGEQSPAPEGSAPVASSDSVAAPAAAEQSPAPEASAPVVGSTPSTVMPADGEEMANEDLPAVMPQVTPVAADEAETVAPDPEVQTQAMQKQPGDVSGQDVQPDTVDSIWVGPPRPRGQEPEPDAGLIDKDALLARLTHEMQGDSVLYKLDGEPAFVDRGMRLEMADGASQNDEKVLAALLTAAQYYRGRIELTGSEAFQRKAIGLIAQHQLNVTMKNPAQQLQLEEARKALAAEPSVKDSIAGDAPPIFDAPTPLTPVSQAPASAPGTEVQAGPEPAASTKPAAANANEAAAPGVAVNGQAASATITVQPQPVGSSPDAEVSAAHRVGPEVHTSPQVASKGVVGKIVAMGDAPFQFDDKNTGSTYITLRTRTGQQTFWGKELAGLIRDTRVQPGKVVTLQWLGKEPVVVKVPVKDADGKTVRYEDKPTHRNNWSLSMHGHPVVRTGDDVGVKLTAYDVQRFGAVQQELMARMNLNVPLPAAPNDGLFWLTPDGQGSAKSGDHLMAPRPAQDPKSAGLPVMSSWTVDGHLDMALVRGDGHYLQGVVRHEGQLQHVLVSLPNRDDAPPMVFNLITDAGMVPIGVGNGINRSGGEAVSRENIAFKLNGDTAARIGKLDKPAELPPALHARLGFDERWRDDNTLPKSAPAAAPTAQPSVQRPA